MTGVTSEAITEPELRGAIGVAHLPSLLAAIGLLTGAGSDDRALRPERYRIIEPHGGMSAAQQRATRTLAFDTLRERVSPEPRFDVAAVERELRPILAADFDAYRELALEELAINGEDRRAPGWRAPPGTALTVAIVGAGMSGMLAAHRLRQAGVDCVVLEKSAGLGGTWLHNQYPGCRVDVPSHLYSYACFGTEDWASEFAPRADVHDALRRFAQRNGLLDCVRFDSEVVEAVFDEAAVRWELVLRTPAGTERMVADAVLSAVGQLSRPSIPDLPGQFAGPAMHTAEWDPETPVAGRRFGVVGTGASAIQVVTGLIDAGARVDVFQRSPAWLFPTPELRRPIPAGQRWLLRTVPTYARWYRLWLQRSVSDGLLPFARCDPGWTGEGAVSAANASMRRSLAGYLQAQFADLPEIAGAMLPAYPPFAKRVIRDDGSWAQAFRSGRATLVTAAIDRLDEAGIVTADGISHRLDAIVYATGFRASEFLLPMRIRGRGGRDLHAEWDGDASAYLGITVPGFPNFFMLYGPNTNVVVNSSAIFFAECQVTYLLDCLREVLTDDGAALDCRPGVHDAFRARIDALNRQQAWGCAGVRNWYTSPSGRVSQNWPASSLEYWERTRTVDNGDYERIRRDGDA